MEMVYSTFFLKQKLQQKCLILPYKTKDTTITLTSLRVVSLSMQKKNSCSAEEMENFI